MEEPRIGVDLGGTAIKAGSLSAAGEILEELPPRSSGVERGAAEVLDRIAAVARELGARERVGVGVPGLLDHASGELGSSPNLQCLEGLVLRSELSRRLDIPAACVHVENDANVAALGEARSGALRGVRHGAMVTLGTGIGGGLILDGELFVGEDMAGEIGHLCVEPGGLSCGCGRRGCVETLASASAASRRARERGLSEDLELLCQRARAGGEAEAELLREVGRDLGRALGMAVNLLDLRCFVFGGGFSAGLDTLEPGIREGIRERAYGDRIEEVRLSRSALGARAGWIGAAHLGPG